MQDRQGKGGGLAGAGLGDAQQVAAGHHARNGLRLDRGGVRVAFVSEGLEQGLGEAKVGKLSQNGYLSDKRQMRPTERSGGREARVVGEAPRVMGESMRSFSLRSTGWV